MALEPKAAWVWVCHSSWELSSFYWFLFWSLRSMMSHMFVYSPTSQISKTRKIKSQCPSGHQTLSTQNRRGKDKHSTLHETLLKPITQQNMPHLPVLPLLHYWVTTSLFKTLLSSFSSGALKMSDDPESTMQGKHLAGFYDFSCDWFVILLLNNIFVFCEMYNFFSPWTNIFT